MHSARLPGCAPSTQKMLSASCWYMNRSALARSSMSEPSRVASSERMVS